MYGLQAWVPYSRESAMKIADWTLPWVCAHCTTPTFPSALLAVGAEKEDGEWGVEEWASWCRVQSSLHVGAGEAT